MIDTELMAAAGEAARSAHCPYSNFRVGAAVLADAKVFSGRNIENASLGLTTCAERVAIFAAVTAGYSFPLNDDSLREFDGELRVMLNRYFGRSASPGGLNSYDYF